MKGWCLLSEMYKLLLQVQSKSQTMVYDFVCIVLTQCCID